MHGGPTIIYLLRTNIAIGIDWVPYPVPRGDDADSNKKPAFVDFGGISATTEHPREAYELLKWMGWDTEGWLAKIEGFKTLENEDGSKIFNASDSLPLTKSPEVWEALKDLYPTEEYPEFEAFWAEALEPIPLGGASQPGFQTFLEEVYFNGDWGGEPNVEVAINNGLVQAADVAPELTDKINQYREEAMDEFF